LSRVDIFKMMNAGGNAAMRSKMSGLLLLCAAMLAAAPAHAWLSYPDRDDPNLTVIEIERATGETIALTALPAPFAAHPEAERQDLVFFWRYERLAEATASFRLDDKGEGTVALAFTARKPSQDLKFGAVLILMDESGTAMHTLYARADLEGGVFAGGDLTHRVAFSVQGPPDWWKRVAKIAFHRMTYYPLQELSDEEVWQAMRRAVARTAMGATEQRAK
jgi:hypothetical protein